MPYDISVTRVPRSRAEGIDFGALAFGKTFGDHMFRVDYADGEWRDARVEPYAPIALEPSNMALHYGQSIFEGMKATVTADGRAMLFRPELNARRINASARRLAMPELPEELFLDGLHALVDLDKAWIPPTEGSSLYIRPFMFATDAALGVRPSDTYTFMIFTSPVGPYYAKPVKLLASTEYVRAAVGGVGEAKAAGNYAASLLPTEHAKRVGCDQVLYLDASEFKYVQEVGTMNVFFVIDGEVVTPELSGAILHGIVRRTCVELLRAEGHQVTERAVAIDELVAAHRAGTLTEVFGTGTAAVVSHVDSILYEGEWLAIPPVAQRTISPWLKDRLEGLRSGRVPDEHGWLVEAGTGVGVA